MHLGRPGLVLAMVALLLAPFAVAQAQEQSAPRRSELEVLYVGPDPDTDPAVPRYLSGEAAKRFPELIRERAPAFRAFLSRHFESVTVVTAEAYEASMSEAHDVTVFDALPRVLKTSGEHHKQRLPDCFDLPAVTVGEVGPMMLGRFGFGLKIDHL